MAQEFNKLISGDKGVGTPFALYPDYINSMFTACMSDFSGTSAPDKPEIGMTYYNTVEKKQYRYLGQTEGWAEAIAGDKTVSDLKTEIETARIGEASLEDRIIKLASMNSGNAFPTGQNVWVGMPCYRKDLQAIYVCTFVDPSGANHTWTDISDLMPGLNALRVEVLNARGVAASLSARLDVSLNHDGSLKGNAPAGEWWEPVIAYTFTKINTDKLEIADGDYTALFETDRAVLLHPSHNKAYVVSSSYENETNKTIVIIDEEVGGDTEIQFGAPVGNASKVKEASVNIAGVVEITDSVRASAEISPEENKVPTEKAVSIALENQKVPLVQDIKPSTEASTEKAPSEKAVSLELEAVDTQIASANSKISAVESKANSNESRISALEEVGGGTVELKSSRSSSGQWSITGLIIGKPLFILYAQPFSGGAYAMLVTSGGSDDGVGYGVNSSNSFVVGAAANNARGNAHVVIPQNNTVSFKIVELSGGTLRAYQ